MAKTIPTYTPGIRALAILNTHGVGFKDENVYIHWIDFININSDCIS
jgi:hypothetical protein